MGKKKKNDETNSSEEKNTEESIKVKKSKGKSKKTSPKISKKTSKKSTKKSKKSSRKPKKSSKKTKKTKKTSKKSTKKSKKSTVSNKSSKIIESSEDLGKEDLSLSDSNLPLPSLDENLQKLLTDEEREKMEENLDLVVCYLEDIGIVDLKIDKKKLIVAVPFDYEDFTFLSHIVLSPEWILIKTSIFELEKLSSNSTTNLYAEVLKGNFILNSVVYSLDPENKSIWAQADVPISADFETFKLNYFSIVFAIDYFMKNISPKLQMQLKSTVEKDTFKNSENNLYI